MVKFFAFQFACYWIHSKNGFDVTLKLITIWLITIIWLILVIEFLKGQTSVGVTR